MEDHMAPPKKVMINKEDLEQWIGVGDASKELGRSKQGIRNMLEREELRGIHTRIGWLIDPTSVRSIHLLRQDEAEREKEAEREASQTHEVGA